MHLIPISSIVVGERQRKEYKGIEELGHSIRKLGLIQPLILEEFDGQFHLRAGGRRLTALKAEGYTEVAHGVSSNPSLPGFVLLKDLTPEQRLEIEYEENLYRSDLSWQERALAVADLHYLKTRNAALVGATWSQQATGELLGYSAGHINWTLQAAKELRDKDSPLWKIEQMIDCVRLFLKRKEDEITKELSSRFVETTPKMVPFTDEEREKLRAKYLQNPCNDPAKVEEYVTEKLTPQVETINLSKRLFCCDAIRFLHEHPHSFDHIITDPPYAIEMDNLDQENVGMNNIDSIRATHDVTDNKALLVSFLLESYKALKDRGFLVFWCDQSQWELLYGSAMMVGFAVQRWPLTWVKTHVCMNTMSQFNFTKTTEIAMVCRKKGTNLVKHCSTSHISAPHDDFKDVMQHPFVKPFAVWEFILNAVSYQGQTICDPFAGEGSGVISALRMNRNVIACEIDQAIHSRLVENVKNHFLALKPNAQFI